MFLMCSVSSASDGIPGAAAVIALFALSLVYHQL